MTVDDAARPAAAVIPAFVNAGGGSAGQAMDALRADARFAVREVEPARLSDMLRAEAASGTGRVLVSGGDGTVATAAAALAGSDVELAVLPGGTLNHFAKSTGIPTDDAAALDVAAMAGSRLVDVGYVNDRIFINTSSVGAYVTYVRMRERLERWMGYWLASFVAGVRILLRLRSFAVTLEVEGQTRTMRTPLVFVGVAEREPVPEGSTPEHRPGLRVVVVPSRGMARTLARALAAASRGDREAALPDEHNFLVDRCQVDLLGARAVVAVDGELVRLTTPLEYRIVRGAVRVVRA
jgi:diacylglycerol kinase family enzyme